MPKARCDVKGVRAIACASSIAGEEGLEIVTEGGGGDILAFSVAVHEASSILAEIHITYAGHSVPDTNRLR